MNSNSVGTWIGKSALAFLSLVVVLPGCSDGDNPIVKQVVPDAIEVDCTQKIGNPHVFVMLNLDAENKLPLAHIEQYDVRPNPDFVRELMALESASGLDDVRRVTGGDYAREQWAGRIMETYTWGWEIPNSGIERSELLYRKYKGCTWRILYTWSAGDDRLAIVKDFEELEE